MTMNPKKMVQGWKNRVLRGLVWLSLFLLVISPQAATAENIQNIRSIGTPLPGQVLNSLTEQERAWLRDHPVIRLAHDPGRPRFEFTKGRDELFGLSGGNLRLVEERLGEKFERMPYRTIPMVIATQVNVNAQCLAILNDWAPLAGILQEALELISAKEREDINRKWLPVRYEHGFNYTLLWQVLGGFAMILLGFVFWIRKLAKEIKQRQEAEQQLRDSEALYHDLVETSQDLIWQCDAEGRYTYLNPAWETVFGYRLDEMLGRPFADFQSPEYAARDTREFARLLQGGSVRAYETVHLAKNGRDLHLVFNAKCVTDKTGRLLGTRGTAYDITERKRAEEALKSSELTYREIFNSVNDAIWIHDLATHKFTDVNKRVEEMFGYTVQEGLNLTVGDISSGVPPFVQETAGALLQKAADGEPQLFEWHCRHKSGRLFWSEVSLKRGTIAGKECILAIERDISARRQAEQALRESEEKFRAIFDFAADAIHLMDGDRFIANNKAAIAMYGYQNPEQMLWATPLDISPERQPDGQLSKEKVIPYIEMAYGGQPQRFQWRHKRVDTGELLDVEVALVRIELGDKTYLLATGRDITDRNRIDSALRESEDLLRRSQSVAQLGSYYFDVQTGTWISSPALDELFGIDDQFSKDVQGWLRLVHPDQQEEMADHLTRHVLEEHNRFEKEYRIRRHRDGEERWVFGLGELEFGTDGKPLAMIGTIQDITERKRANEALLAEKQFSEGVINSLPGFFYVLDESGHMKRWNSNLETISGYSMEEIRGMTALQFVSSETLDDAYRAIREVFENGESQVEATLLRKDGVGIPCLFTGKCLQLPGAPRLLAGMAIDISQRKLAEENLRESEERFAVFMAHLPAAAFIKDTAGHTVFANRYLQELFQFQEWQGKSTPELISGEVAEKMVEDDRRALEGLVEVQESIMDAQGKERVFQTWKFPIRLAGKPVLLGGISVDITERKQAEEDLRASEERFGLFMKYLPGLAIVKDHELRVLYVNDMYEKIFGIPAPQWLGKNTMDIWPPEIARATRNEDETVLKENRPVVTIQDIPTRGEWRTFRKIKFPITLPDGPTLIGGLAIDITELKRAEEALRSTIAEKEALLREVHHRVKNNLQVISSLLSLQFRKVKKDELRSFLQDTQNRVRSMSLLHEILYRSGDLAHIDFPKYVQNICNHLVRSYGMTAGGIRLQLQVTPVALSLDQAITVGMIINELVSNAFKHAFPLSVEGQIRVDLQAINEQQLLLRISDNGIGLPDESLQQDRQTLGLLLVKNFSQHLDGTLTIHRRPETKFEIIFPIQPLKGK